MTVLPMTALPMSALPMTVLTVSKYLIAFIKLKAISSLHDQLKTKLFNIHAHVGCNASSDTLSISSGTW